MSPGQDALPGRVDDLGLAAVGREAPRFGHGLDDAAREEDVLPSERLRREDLSAAYQGDHGRLLEG